MGKPRVLRVRRRAKKEKGTRVVGGAINKVIPKAKGFTETTTYQFGIPVKDPGSYPSAAFAKIRSMKAK